MNWSNQKNRVSTLTRSAIINFIFVPMRNGIKYSILLLISALTLSGVNAQRIAMVDIAGHRDSFIARFESKLGFVRVADEQKIPILRGTLNGEPADLRIFETPLSHRVYKVEVRFRSFPKWIDAKSYYLNKLNGLKKKYGEPVITKQGFEKPYCDGGGKEFEAIQNNKAQFYIDWGDMPYIQNLFLQYWISGDTHVYLSFTLKDELMKYEEEKELAKNALF